MTVPSAKQTAARANNNCFRNFASLQRALERAGKYTIAAKVKGLRDELHEQIEEDKRRDEYRTLQG